MILTEEQFEDYLNPVDINQSESIRLLRALVLDCEPDLDERICEDKWYGGLLLYSAKNGYPIYALGPRSAGKTTLHMLPYYGSSELQAKYGAVLKKFASGKSCLTFIHARELPLDAVREICTGGKANLLRALAARDQARKIKRKAS
jgi:hypothetical protein